MDATWTTFTMLMILAALIGFSRNPAGKDDRPFKLLLLLWLPFFLFFAFATLSIPLVHDIATATGIAAWVSEHLRWWQGLLVISFGAIAGGWLNAKFRQASSSG